MIFLGFYWNFCLIRNFFDNLQFELSFLNTFPPVKRSRSCRSFIILLLNLLSEAFCLEALILFINLN